jgi:hypothetical protein
VPRFQEEVAFATTAYHLLAWLSSIVHVIRSGTAMTMQSWAMRDPN